MERLDWNTSVSERWINNKTPDTFRMPGAEAANLLAGIVKQ